MERNFLDAYYKLEREHWWFQVRERIIIDRLKALVPAGGRLRILNVGAATGRSSEILQPFGEVQSLEYDYPSYVFCRDVLALPIDNGSILELPYADGQFDLVCAFDVVEHVEDDHKAVSELFRVCKTGGKVFVTVPAFMSLWSTHDLVNQHFRRYTRPGLRRLFSASGWKPERSSYFNFLLFCPIWLVRRVQALFVSPGSGASLKPDNELASKGLLSKWLFRIFDVDRWLLKFVDLPFGVSIFLVASKEK